MAHKNEERRLNADHSAVGCQYGTKHTEVLGWLARLEMKRVWEYGK